LQKNTTMKKLLAIVLCIFAYSCFAQTPEGYRRLGLNLDAVGELRQHRFTTFIGLDVNFAHTRFERFLQDPAFGMTADRGSVQFEHGRSMSIRFWERVSSRSRPSYITIRYELENSTTKPPYIPTEDGSTNIITRVQITGSANSILSLFQRYWNQTVHIEGNPRGEIASYQVLGDRVVLMGGSDPNVLSIVIERGNIDFDYYATFNIVATDAK